MDADVNNLMNKLLDFLTSESGQNVVTEVVGVANSGSESYLQAVVVAEALGRVTGAMPDVIDNGNDTYVIRWVGPNRETATLFFRDAIVSSVSDDGSVKPVTVDFGPVLAPLAVKYAMPAIAIGIIAVFLAGNFYGRIG